MDNALNQQGLAAVPSDNTRPTLAVYKTRRSLQVTRGNHEGKEAAAPIVLRSVAQKLLQRHIRKTDARRVAVQ